MSLPDRIVTDLTQHPGPWIMRDLRDKYHAVAARYLRATLKRMIEDGRIVRSMRFGRFHYGVPHAQ